MGMTIDVDESIKELSKWRKDLNYDNGDYCYGDDTTKYSLDIAINILRKYQKIQQIIHDDWAKGYQHSETLNRIKEVLKNDDK